MFTKVKIYLTFLNKYCLSLTLKFFNKLLLNNYKILRNNYFFTITKIQLKSAIFGII